MAFNVQTFRTRALTAIVFVVVMLCGLLINSYSFYILFSIIHFGCWVEYQKLIGIIQPSYQRISIVHKYGVMLLGWSFLLLMMNDVLPKEVVENTLAAILAILIVTELKKKNFSIKNIGLSALGLLYISVSWMLMISLYKQSFFLLHDGRILPVILIASIWINDTMAYIVGSFIGKTPLSSISPKKTWEGTLGGALLAVMTVTSVGYFVFNLPLFIVLIISIIAAIAGTFGDLLESKLKRLAGVKDSGQIMPGHGGFLDRFDSLLLATLFVWLFVFLLRYYTLF